MAEDQEIRNVTVAGITGAVGPAIVRALSNAGFHVQALHRHNATSRPNLGGVAIVEVDYTDAAQLEQILQGQHAVISALGDTPGALAAQAALITAAVAAGVSRFVPSEYGSDTLHGRVRAFPFFADMLQHQDLLKRAAAAHPAFSYSLLITGPFLDWGLSVVPFIVNVGDPATQRERPPKTPSLPPLPPPPPNASAPFPDSPHAGFDGGDVPFSTTRVATLAAALASLLARPAATRNRVLYIHDAITTQNALLAIAERLDTRLHFADASVDMRALEAEAWAHYTDPAATDPTGWVFSFVNTSIWGREQLCCFRENDNELLGVRELRGEELEAVLREEVGKAIRVFAGFGSVGGEGVGGCGAAAEQAMEEGRGKLVEGGRAE
ncbi:hypothetical protein LTR53_009484 [Teratosphaeriaceae sp. CCFEE 6253]|nr:hypothetical protein LTR53_009484 [Teratosphaeriaceae sp. CCFEE 6253]